VASLLSRFIRANRALCARLEPHLPQARLNISLHYELTVAEHMRRLTPGSIVVDAGGGRKCCYAEYKPEGIEIVAADVSGEELSLNKEADRGVVADVSTRLPFADSSVDIVTSKHLLEHLPDISRFVAESHRVLKPGGLFASLLPSRYALFAILSRLLPDSARENLVHRLVAETDETHRFHTYYDRCYAGALEHVLVDAGFEIVELVPGYYGAGYFSFSFPLWLAVVGWELATMLFGCRNLAASVMVAARKRTS